MLWVKMSLGDLKDWIMVSDTFNITALIIWIVRTIIYIFFIGIKQTVYIKPMITRVPVSISVGTRGTRELLMSLLVEALNPIPLPSLRLNLTFAASAVQFQTSQIHPKCTLSLPSVCTVKLVEVGKL